MNRTLVIFSLFISIAFAAGVNINGVTGTALLYNGGGTQYTLGYSSTWNCFIGSAGKLADSGNALIAIKGTSHNISSLTATTPLASVTFFANTSGLFSSDAYVVGVKVVDSLSLIFFTLYSSSGRSFFGVYNMTSRHIIRNVELTNVASGNAVVVNHLDVDPSTQNAYVCDGKGRIILVTSSGSARVLVQDAKLGPVTSILGFPYNSGRPGASAVAFVASARCLVVANQDFGDLFRVDLVTLNVANLYSTNEFVPGENYLLNVSTNRGVNPMVHVFGLLLGLDGNIYGVVNNGVNRIAQYLPNNPQYTTLTIGLVGSSVFPSATDITLANGVVYVSHDTTSGVIVSSSPTSLAQHVIDSVILMYEPTFQQIILP